MKVWTRKDNESLEMREKVRKRRKRVKNKGMEGKKKKRKQALKWKSKD